MVTFPLLTFPPPSPPLPSQQSLEATVSSLRAELQAVRRKQETWERGVEGERMTVQGKLEAALKEVAVLKAHNRTEKVCGV